MNMIVTIRVEEIIILGINHVALNFILKFYLNFIELIKLSI